MARLVIGKTVISTNVNIVGTVMILEERGLKILEKKQHFDLIFHIIPYGVECNCSSRNDRNRLKKKLCILSRINKNNIKLCRTNVN